MAVALIFHAQKVPFVIQVHGRVTLFPIKMVLNECLMTEHGVSPASETANEAGCLRQTHLPACRRARPGRGETLPPGSLADVPLPSVAPESVVLKPKHASVYAGPTPCQLAFLTAPNGPARCRHLCRGKAERRMEAAGSSPLLHEDGEQRRPEPPSRASAARSSSRRERGMQGAATPQQQPVSLKI